MPLGTLLLLVATFVAVNALFVAAEFALISAPRPAIEHRATEGDPLARRLHDILTSAPRQDRYIATSQLGVTMASVGLGMFGEHELAPWIVPHLAFLGATRVVTVHLVATVTAVAVLAFVHIVIGEMVPKSLALQRSEGMARVLYWPMRVILILTYPIVATLHAVGRACLAVMGVHREHDAGEESYTPEELQLIVAESEQGGAIRAEAGRLLRELFEFGDLTAEQAMVPRVRVVGIAVGATPDDVRALLLKHRHTRYPVYEHDLDHIVGMLHVKDLLRRLILSEPVSRNDVRPMPVVPATAPLDDVLAEMQRAHAHLVVVIDEHGGTAGVLSFEDLSEEVVGEIDEGFSDTPALIVEAPGVVRALGTLRLDELGEKLGVEVEHEDVDSVSGLVLARLGRPPAVGDVVEYGPLRLEVTALAGRGVGEVRASIRDRPLLPVE
jgi:CBS domain containing-hemolysin-like protein